MIAPHGVIASYSSSRVREPVFPYYDLAPKDVTLRIVQGKIIPDATRLAGVALITQLMQSGTLIHPPPSPIHSGIWRLRMRRLKAAPQPARSWSKGRPDAGRGVLS